VIAREIFERDRRGWKPAVSTSGRHQRNKSFRFDYQGTCNDAWQFSGKFFAINALRPSPPMLDTNFTNLHEFSTQEFEYRQKQKDKKQFVGTLCDMFPCTTRQVERLLPFKAVRSLE